MFQLWLGWGDLVTIVRISTEFHFGVTQIEAQFMRFAVDECALYETGHEQLFYGSARLAGGMGELI